MKPIKILRAIKAICGKTHDEIGNGSQYLCTKGNSPNLDTMGKFAKGAGYTLTGILIRDDKKRLVYIAENGKAFEVMSMASIKVPKRATGYPVAMCDLDGKVLETFPNISTAARETGADSNGISKVIRGVNKTCNRRKWRRLTITEIKNKNF